MHPETASHLNSHFNLMPLLFFLHLVLTDCGRCMIPLRFVFVWFSRIDFDIRGSHSLRASPLSAYPLSLRFSTFSLSLSSKSQSHRIQCQTAMDQTSSFSSVSRSQLLMYKMKQCYKPNKNVLPLDSPTVNIWPLISVNILHNYVWL